MPKIIRLTEADIQRLVQKIIKEESYMEEPEMEPEMEEPEMEESPEDSRTPIQPITIHGKTYKFVEDIPFRQLGIGGYVVNNDIVLVNGDTPLKDWIEDNY